MNRLFDQIDFQTHLGYVFNMPELLAEALRHSSFVNEQVDFRLNDNERLEFLGDAVLNLAIGHLLMHRHPHLKEGELSRIRSHMVNEVQLADIARQMQLGQYLKLGRGESQSGGNDKNSILADAFEAVVAAVYLDGGYSAAFSIVERVFKPLIDAAPEMSMGMDFKSRLQEEIQSHHHVVPHYQIIEEIGPDHDKTFRVLMTVGDLRAEGIGKSKKMAEQEAARQGLRAMESGRSLSTGNPST
jgi:ribonuclease III